MKYRFDGWQKIALATLVLGFFAHGFAFSSGFFAHDSLREMAVHSELFHNIELKVSVGRFVQPLVFLFRGEIAAPWLIGCLSLVWMGLAALLLTDLFGLKSGILVVGLLVTQVSVTLTNSFYIHEGDMFALALFFGVASGYVYAKVPKFGWILSPVLMAVTCGLYQGFFGVTILVFQLLIVARVLDKEPPIILIKEGFRAVFTLIFGLILYFILYQGVLWGTGIQATSENYNSLPTLATLPDFFLSGEFFRNVTRMYQEVFLVFFEPVTHSTRLVMGVNALLVLVFLGSYVWLCWKGKLGGISCGILVFVLILTPFAGNFSSFFSGFSHQLMTAPLVLLYVYVLFGVERLQHRPTTWLTWGLISLLLWQNVIYANQMYLRQQLAYDNTLSTMTRVLSDIEKVDGYVVGETPVLFSGVVVQSPVAQVPEYFHHLDGVGVEDHFFSVSYYHGNLAYFSNVLGYPMNFSEEYHLVKEEPIVSMPGFPTPGYCQMVEGTVVVKWN